MTFISKGLYIEEVFACPEEFLLRYYDSHDLDLSIMATAKSSSVVLELSAADRSLTSAID